MLLPSWFREEYADEMLWIFDQTTGARWPLVLDVAWSVVRQWLGSMLFWQYVLIVGTAPLPYLFGIQVWKDLKPLGEQSLSRDALLGAAEIAVVLVLFLISLVGVAWFRRATAMTRYRPLLKDHLDSTDDGDDTIAARRI